MTRLMKNAIMDAGTSTAAATNGFIRAAKNMSITANPSMTAAALRKQQE